MATTASSAEPLRGNTDMGLCLDIPVIYSVSGGLSLKCLGGYHEKSSLCTQICELTPAAANFLIDAFVHHYIVNLHH